MLEDSIAKAHSPLFLPLTRATMNTLSLGFNLLFVQRLSRAIQTITAGLPDGSTSITENQQYHASSSSDHACKCGHVDLVIASR